MKPAPASDRVLLDYMRQCVDRIREYTGSERARFMGSRLIQDAVIRNLHTLSGSSQRPSERLRATEPGIAWRKMGGMRNILVHDHLGGIDMDTAWVVIERDLPALADAIERMIRRLDSGAST